MVRREQDPGRRRGPSRDLCHRRHAPSLDQDQPRVRRLVLYRLRSKPGRGLIPGRVHPTGSTRPPGDWHRHPALGLADRRYLVATWFAVWPFGAPG